MVSTKIYEAGEGDLRAYVLPAVSEKAWEMLLAQVIADFLQNPHFSYQMEEKHE